MKTAVSQTGRGRGPRWNGTVNRSWRCTTPYSCRACGVYAAKHNLPQLSSAVHQIMPLSPQPCPLSGQLMADG